MIFYGDQNIRLKKITIRTRPFSSSVVLLKVFSSKYWTLKQSKSIKEKHIFKRKK